MKALTFCVLTFAPVPPPAPPDPLGTPKQPDFVLWTTANQKEDGTIYTIPMNLKEVGPETRADGFVEWDVVKKIGGTPVETDTEFMERLRFYRPGAVVPVQVERSGKTLTINLKVR